jgi:hypothetical protein
MLEVKKIEACSHEEQNKIVCEYLDQAHIKPAKPMTAYDARMMKFLTPYEVLEVLEVYEYIDQPAVYKTLHRVVNRLKPWRRFIR